MTLFASRNLGYTLLFVLLSQLLSAQNKPELNLSEFDLQQLHMVTYQHTFSKHYISWSVQYREFKKRSKEFRIPITLSFGKTNMNKDFLENKNIKDVDTYSFGMGFDGYEYLGSGFYFNLGIGVSPGLETVDHITEGKSTKFLIGGNINTGLLYVPFPDFGLVIGGKIIGNLSNSSVLDRSLGFAIEAGINF
ncbi:hypothetical protein [Aquimarina spongiae]|uniref:Outer membrane protein beta-barrel domain-containing protein n=1 Tax=Aquimarina spongiae TaxID=570521 RepID=A0A1M6GJS6_9FLAO|nr:hypothetical protein [Aquimarina spongiae]SHJ10197.1 hypothetical protein SAMN04488508_105318 [Aquimarina spongiae]